MNKLESLREEIDKIDSKILELLKRRIELSKNIGAVKRELGLTVKDKKREQSVLNRVRRSSERIGFDPLELEGIFKTILMASKRVQGEDITAAFLGPEGTFCEQAVRRYFFNKPVTYAERPSIQDVFRSVEWNEAEYGVVPVENSLEGSVNITLDMLLETDLKIRGEIEERISHNLLSKPGMKIDNITTILSHPQAVAQCRKYIETNLQKIKIIETTSTAKAVIKAQKMKNAAAIGTELSAKVYSMEILAKGIEDAPFNYTRFFVLSKKDSEPTGNDKTSVIFSVPHIPGSLHKTLGVFSKKGVNLTKIESRPARRGSWEYLFYCDFEGHRLTKPCIQVLKELKENCTYLKTLGSYPKVK
jgi:chorismate mutase/prephenate dehydratase